MLFIEASPDPDPCAASLFFGIRLLTESAAQKSLSGQEITNVRSQRLKYNFEGNLAVDVTDIVHMIFPE